MFVLFCFVFNAQLVTLNCIMVETDGQPVNELALFVLLGKTEKILKLLEDIEPTASNLTLSF